MTAQEMLIKKFHIKTHILLDYKLSWGKNNNIYIVEQLETVHSYICIVAFHLGTIEEPREWHDDGVEPEDGGCGHV